MDSTGPSGVKSWLLLGACAVLGGALVTWLALRFPRGALRFLVPAWPAVLTALVVALFIAAAVIVVNRNRREKEQAVQLEAVRRAREDSNDARMRFLRRLDHELKNPVMALRALAAEGAAGQGDEHTWEAAGTQALRMSRLVGDLRGLAELEATPLDVEPVDVGEAMAEALADLAEGERAEEIKERAVSVHLPRAPWPLSKVPGDPDWLRLVFHNVLGNAVKYSAPGDRIEVTGSEADGWVDIEVADTGRGIPQEEVGLVFEELARASNSGDQDGSGVGLSLVKIIVTRHGGKVMLRSRVGEGTSVRLRFPAA